MMMRRLLLILTLVVSQTLHAEDVTDKFVQATQKFEEARAGSAAAVAPAQAAFKDLLASDPQNPLFLAYYGSTFAMQARDGGAPWQKIGRVHEAIDNIDRALGLLGPQHDTQALRGVPISLETRLVAIATYVPLPSFFNRMDVARQQLSIALASPLFAAASTELRGRFLYEDALIARADGDSERERRSLRQVVNYAPPSLNMNEVRGELAKLGG
jgi:tetratricopeptide (TPR) repeat protein